MTTDRAAIDQALAALLDSGALDFAQGGYFCCPRCGINQIARDHGDDARFVFWCVQSQDSAFEQIGHPVCPGCGGAECDECDWSGLGLTQDPHYSEELNDCGLYLTYGFDYEEVGWQVVFALEAQGLTVEWDGDSGRCIFVRGLGKGGSTHERARRVLRPGRGRRRPV